MTESAGTLGGATQAAALGGQTLYLVDGELIGFTSAKLTAANKYALTGLAARHVRHRAGRHSIGAPFARLDGAVVQYALPGNLIGQTVYLKFQSFNVFGGGLQDLSTCAAYSYAPSGGGAVGPVALPIARSSAGLGLRQPCLEPLRRFRHGDRARPMPLIDLGSVTS